MLNVDTYLKLIMSEVAGAVTDQTHPELHAKVLELAGAANIKPPSKILIVKEDKGFPNASMTSGGKLLLGEGLLKTLGYEKHLEVAGAANAAQKAPVVISKELEAIIGHELGHSTRIKKDIALVYGAAALPLLFFVGYKIYEHAKRRKKERGAHINHHIEIITTELEQGVKEKTDGAAAASADADKKTEASPNSTTPPADPIKSAATLHAQMAGHHEHPSFVRNFSKALVKNVAIYIAAMVVSVPFIKLAGRNVEFAADKFGGKLAGGNEHMISALKKLEPVTLAAFEKAGISKVELALRRFFDYHPSLDARVSNLQR